MFKFAERDSAKKFESGENSAHPLNVRVSEKFIYRLENLNKNGDFQIVLIN